MFDEIRVPVVVKDVAAAAASAAAAAAAAGSGGSENGSAVAVAAAAADGVWSIVQRVQGRWNQTRNEINAPTEFELSSLIWSLIFLLGLLTVGCTIYKARQTLARRRLEAAMPNKED
jgi:hypothetical protein